MEMPSGKVLERIGRAILLGWELSGFHKRMPRQRHAMWVKTPDVDGYYAEKVDVPDEPETADEWITRLLDSAGVPE